MTTLIRAQAKRWLYEELASNAAALDCEVTYGPPTRDVGRRIIAIGPATAVKHSVPTMKSGRKARDDAFDIAVTAWGWNGGDANPYDLEVDVQDLFALVEDALADDATMGGLSGLLSAVVRNVDGPTSTPTENGEGWQSWITCVVHCATRLT